MLAILVNEDVSHLIFDANLCDRFYQNKPIKPFLFFDVTSVLVHYILALDTMDDLGTYHLLTHIFLTNHAIMFLIKKNLI